MQLRSRARQRLSSLSLADGGDVPRTGRIRGPGSGTSDSIRARMPVDSFVLPADSTEQMADVQVSDGETAIAPETVKRIGAAALLAMRDSTHKPEPIPRRRSARQRLANGGEVEKPTANSFGDAAAVAAGGGSVAQIPTTGYPAAPDGNQVDSSELGRNLSNAAQALPGGASALAGAARAASTVRGIMAGGLGGIGLANTASRVADSPSAEPATSAVVSATPAPPIAELGLPSAPPGPDAGSSQPSPAPAPYDLANGKDVGFGVRRFDGGSSPLFTNVPDAANNAALMGRGKISEQNMRAADGLQAREDERFRRDQAVEQHNREVAEAQAINSRPVRTTGGSMGFRRDPQIEQAARIANTNYNRMIGADNLALDRAVKRDGIAARLQEAMNAESGRNMRAQWNNDVDRDRLALDAGRADIDARSKMNMLGAQDAYLNAKTPEARSTALANLRALAGQSAAPTLMAVKGAKRSDGSADADRVVSSTGEWLEPPSPQRTPPAAAIDQLRRNPQMAAQFDQHYGKGASARVLGR